MIYFFFYLIVSSFFNDTATTEIYTLSLHDALPTWGSTRRRRCARRGCTTRRASCTPSRASTSDRKSTRLNSSHANISYAVFCLKKKKKYNKIQLNKKKKKKKTR